jgi:hypothetical protein
MVTTAAAELAITVTDALDDSARAVIADGLAGYNDQKTGYRDYRPLAVLVSDPDTGEVVGGLFGRTSFGLLFVERFFCPRIFAAAGSAAGSLRWQKQKLNGAAAPVPLCSRSPFKRRAFISSRATTSRRGSIAPLQERHVCS